MSTKLTPAALLECDDNYVFASWLIEGENEQVIAIFRRASKSTAWALEQFRGPFSEYSRRHTPESEAGFRGLHNNSDHPAFEPAALAAVSMHNDLNFSLEETKQSWKGKLYDR